MQSCLPAAAAADSAVSAPETCCSTSAMWPASSPSAAAASAAADPRSTLPAPTAAGFISSETLCSQNLHLGNFPVKEPIPIDNQSTKKDAVGNSGAQEENCYCEGSFKHSPKVYNPDNPISFHGPHSWDVKMETQQRHSVSVGDCMSDIYNLAGLRSQ